MFELTTNLEIFYKCSARLSFLILNKNAIGKIAIKENKLIELSKIFTVDIVNLCTDIKENRKGNVLLNQLLRSGTSIGANIHEANYASSKADFINKLQIALKECYESDYWLGLFKETKMITEIEYADMYDKCSKIRKLLIASINTAKGNQ